MNIYIRKFWSYKDLLFELVNRDIKLKYRRSFLGYLWTLLNPLFIMLITTAVFSQIFRFSVENYPIYILSGQIIFTFFSESTTTAMNSILGNASFLRKIYVPKYIFPVSRVISSFVNLLFALVAMIIMMVIFKVPITWHILFIPLPLICIFLFCTGLGLILSVLAVYFRDVIHIYNVLLTGLMYFTPLFYPVDILPNVIFKLMHINPMYHFVTYFRSLLYMGEFPSLEQNILCMGISLSFLLIGLAFFKERQSKFVLYI